MDVSAEKKNGDLPTSENRMLGERKENIMVNGKSEDGESDNTAQVLKDIAILNGQATEFEDDHIKDFTSKSNGDVPLDSGINSVSSSSADSKAENGDEMEVEKIPDSPEVDKSSKKDKETSDGAKVDKDNKDKDSSKSTGDDAMDVEDAVVVLDNDSSCDSFADKKDKNTGNAKPSGDADDAVVVIDKDKGEDSNDSESVKGSSLQNGEPSGSKEDVAEVYEKVLDELDPDDKTPEKPKKYEDGKDQPTGSKTDKDLTDIQNHSPALKDALQKAAAPPSIQIKDVTSLAKDEKPKKKKKKPSKVKQAMAKVQAPDLRPMAGVLASIGEDLIRESVYNDLYVAQTKKQAKNQLSKREEEQLDRLKNGRDTIAKRNKVYTADKTYSCPKCQYTTVSKNQLEFHKEHAHKGSHGNHECAMCDFETKNRNAMAFHMEAEHDRQCKWLSVSMSFYVCSLCRYESNTARQFMKHKDRCEKNFKLDRNMEPLPADCDIPIKPLIKPKPASAMVIKQNQAPQIQSFNTGLRQVVTRPNFKQNHVNSLLANSTGGLQQVRPIAPQVAIRGQLAGANRAIVTSQPIQNTQGQQIVQVQGQLYSLFYSQGQAFLTPLGQASNVPPTPVRGQVLNIAQRPIAPARPPVQIQNAQQRLLLNTDEISRRIAAEAIAKAAQGKALSAANRAGNKNISQTLLEKKASAAVFPKEPVSGFEICEICGGFVKDRDSLRIHFVWAHKIDIPKALFATKKPHMICGRQNNRGQPCKERFWTYQGLSRHREVAHGDPTAAQSNLQTRSCYMCGEQGIVSLIGHLRTQHYLQVGNWLRNFKCVCCGKQLHGRADLEQHLLKVHGKVFLTKGLIDQLSNFSQHVTPRSGPAVPTGLFQNANSGKKRPAPVGRITKPVSSSIVYPCNSCEKDFATRQEFEAHQKLAHSHKCSRCPQRFNTREALNKHYNCHKNDKDQCPLCPEKVLIGRPYVRHMKRTHLKECSVVIMRLSAEKDKFYTEKWKKQAAEIRESRQAKGKASVIVLDSDDEGEAKASSKRVLDHSTDGEPPAKRARGASEDETVTVLDIDEDGNHIGTESLKSLEEKAKSDESPAKEENKTSESAEKKKDNVEILEVDGETIIVQKEDD